MAYWSYRNRKIACIDGTSSKYYLCADKRGKAENKKPINERMIEGLTSWQLFALSMGLIFSSHTLMMYTLLVRSISILICYGTKIMKKLGAVCCGVLLCVIVWCGMVWCSVVHFNVVWCYVVWCTLMWCVVVYYSVVWCGVVWCGVVWCGVVWCDVMWCDVVWCGVMWCDVVWCVV